MQLFWAYITNRTNQILPRTIREKQGDTISILQKMIKYKGVYYNKKESNFTLVRVEVKVLDAAKSTVKE